MADLLSTVLAGAAASEVYLLICSPPIISVRSLRARRNNGTHNYLQLATAAASCAKYRTATVLKYRT